LETNLIFVFILIKFIKQHIMKTISLFTFVILFIFASLSENYVKAEEISIQTAKNVALNIYAEKSGKSIKDLKITKVIEQKRKGVVCLYILKYSDKGFAVISADDIVQPVLGYSFESYYDETNIAPPFEYYVLERSAKQIYEAKQSQMEASKETINEWNKYSADPSYFQASKGTKAFTPLLTTSWHQRWPYNAHCPADTAGPGDHVFVGCVATAMAQVLNYWHHPWHGTGMHSYLDDTYGTQVANFGITYYNFDNMPDIATEYHSDLAELCYHCGVSVDMDYGTSGSGASMSAVETALEDYFYFDDDAVLYNRTSFTHSVWVTKINDNLNANRPVIYAAFDGDTGHTWVMDANDGSDFFHCNWGWGGDYDGWYSIDNLNPGSIHFNDSENAVFNIHPKEGSLHGTLTLAGSPYIYNYNQIINSSSQLIIEPGVEIIFNGRYKFIVKGQLLAEGTASGPISFSAQVPGIGMQGITFSNLNNNSMDSSRLIHCNFENGKGSWDKLIRYSSGGDVYCENSAKIRIEECDFTNSSAKYGGAIACFDSSAIALRECYIHHDTAVMGGGVYLKNSDVRFYGNLIDGNNTTTSSGGGVYCDFSDAVFSNDSILNNQAHFTGGIGCFGSYLTLDHVAFINNSADNYCGGLFSGSNSNVVMNNCYFTENQGNESGSVMVWFNSSVEMNRVLMHDNNATSGATIFITGASSAAIYNCTMAYNSMSNKTNGIYLEDTSSVMIKNSILWDNGTNEIARDDDGSQVSVSYSILKSGDWTGDYVISDNPLFTNYIADDYTLSWDGFPIPDEGKSPAIDSGDPASPADPDGTPADMGYQPYEQIYTTLPGGDISGTLTCAGSPYYVFDNLTVPAGETLTIEPCVTVMFRGQYTLEVKGTLLAEADGSDRITFISLPLYSLRWGGIRFVNTGSQDSSKLIHCRISYGDARSPSSGGAIYFNSSSNVRVENCLINKNDAFYYGGALFLKSSEPVLKNNTIVDNYAQGGGAIYFQYCSPVVSGGSCENNRSENGGAFYFNSSHPVFKGVKIINNIARFGGGCYFYGSSTPQFDTTDKCDIYSNYASIAGLDMFGDDNWWGSPLSVTVDTFTVINPSNHFIFPQSEFDVNIQHGKISQIGGDLYVATDGDDNNSGTSPSEPLKTLRMAMMKTAASQSSPVTVFLAPGTYDVRSTEEYLPVNCRSYVSISGDNFSNTILEGDYRGGILSLYGDSALTISGITVKKGFEGKGGGIFIDGYSSAVFDNMLINLCIGGGIYCGGHSSPYFINCQVNHNVAWDKGGGIYVDGSSYPVFENTEITENEAAYRGGGIYSQGTNFEMKRCLIMENKASYGGGIDTDSKCLIENCRILKNTAINFAGYPATGGGVYIGSPGDATFKETVISQNTSEDNAGGIKCKGDILLENCKITDNSAENNGGGIYLSGSAYDKRIVNCQITGNSVQNYHAPAVFIQSSSPVFINTTISGNSTPFSSGSGIYCTSNSTPEFINSILWDNVPVEINLATGSSVTATYCDIEGGWPGTGNIDLDPLFESYYHLTEFSPCVNAGTPDTTGLHLPEKDLYGSARISGSGIDMGAYEYGGRLVSINAKAILEGAYNGGSMNYDIEELIPAFQPYSAPPWNYDGLENFLLSDLLESVRPVDWVLLELRDANSPAEATSSATIAQRAALLTDSGMIVNKSGNEEINFYNINNDYNLYLVIRHRNHLGVISANPLTESGGIYSYDFTTTGQAYGTDAQKDLGSGVFGMYAGDANADGTIDNDDVLLWKNDAGTKGYLSTDLNLDSQADNKDKNDFWLINIGNECQVPD
jgi:parallel beta-helix repeat protein